MRDDLIKDILDVLKYQNGQYYVGGMQRCNIATMLDINYTESKLIDYARAIQGAEKSKLMELYKYLKREIDYMKKNPVTICKHCGK